MSYSPMNLLFKASNINQDKNKCKESPLSHFGEITNQNLHNIPFDQGKKQQNLNEKMNNQSFLLQLSSNTPNNFNNVYISSPFLQTSTSNNNKLMLKESYNSPQEKFLINPCKRSKINLTGSGTFTPVQFYPIMIKNPHLITKSETT